MLQQRHRNLPPWDLHRLYNQGDVSAARENRTGSEIKLNRVRHAVAGVVQDLETLGGRNSSATGINAADPVIGSSEVQGGAIHAFLHNSGLEDLGNLVGRNGLAKVYNGDGEVVGKAEIWGCVRIGFTFQ